MNWKENFLVTIKNFTDIAFSSSFSIEDQLITHFIAEQNLPVEIFTLDTGRLPRETYDVWQNTLEKYYIKISAFYPDQQILSGFVNKYGINAFYGSKELRLECCEIRKVEPLRRALKNKKLWISGLRKEHSKTRSDKSFLEKDEALNLVKFYPLLESTTTEIWEEIHAKNIPFNRLYDQGYQSVGCAPCTRAVRPNGDSRSGRWWWERDHKKECGIHAMRPSNPLLP